MRNYARGGARHALQSRGTSAQYALCGSKPAAGDIKSAGSLRAHYNKTLTHSQARYAMPNLRCNHHRNTR